MKHGYRRIGHFGLHWYRPRGVPLVGLALMRGAGDRIIGISGGVRWIAFAAYHLSPEWYFHDRRNEAQRARRREAEMDRLRSASTTAH